MSDGRRVGGKAEAITRPTESSRKRTGRTTARNGIFSMHRQLLDNHRIHHLLCPPPSTSLPCHLAFSGSLGSRFELPRKHTHLNPITMQRAFASRARTSALNQSSKLRSTSLNLQQQRFAHKVGYAFLPTVYKNLRDLQFYRTSSLA
jgi:hypothetical protein